MKEVQQDLSISAIIYFYLFLHLPLFAFLLTEKSTVKGSKIAHRLRIRKEENEGGSILPPLTCSIFQRTDRNNFRLHPVFSREQISSSLSLGCHHSSPSNGANSTANCAAAEKRAAVSEENR